MGLVSCSLNRMDNIFSTRRLPRWAKESPLAPMEHTQLDTYTLDSWGKWKIVCVSIHTVLYGDATDLEMLHWDLQHLDVEDVADIFNIEDIEDICIIWFLIMRLPFGVGCYLEFHDIRKTLSAVQAIGNLPRSHEGTYRAVNTQTQMLCNQNQNLNTILAESHRSIWNLMARRH